MSRIIQHHPAHRLSHYSLSKGKKWWQSSSIFTVLTFLWKNDMLTKAGMFQSNISGIHFITTSATATYYLHPSTWTSSSSSVFVFPSCCCWFTSHSVSVGSSCRHISIFTPASFGHLLSHHISGSILTSDLHSDLWNSCVYQIGHALVQALHNDIMEKNNHMLDFFMWPYA